MNFTKTALEKNRVTLTFLLVIIVSGWLSFVHLPQAEDPGFLIRVAQVITYFPGASPERVENLVSDKIEKAVKEMPELDFVTSESKTGVSIVNVNIKESYTNLRPIWDKLRRKIEDIDDLPDGIIGPDVEDEFGDVYGIVVGLRGEGFSYAEIKDVADQVRDELLLIDDVAKVDILAEQEERVFVEFNNSRLAEVGLSPGQLKDILEKRNIIISGGSVNTADERLALEPSGNFESLDELRKTVINVPGEKDMIYLEDITTIKRGYIDPPKELMRHNGVSCLGLAISMRDGGNVVVLGGKIKKLLDRLEKQYPVGYSFDMVSYQPDRVTKIINDFVSNLYQSCGVVIFTMVCFLGLRVGFVVASLIPLSMLMSMLLMSVFNIGLDQMSIASLIIALGMLVDNGIVVSESILVKMEEGQTAFTAAVESSQELAVSLLTSSMTTAAAFLPIFLAESSVGEYTAPLFKVVSIALFSSWTIALTIIPLLGVFFFRVKKSAEVHEAFSSKFYVMYRNFLKLMMARPVLSLGTAGALFILAIIGFATVPYVFFPDKDDAFFTVDMFLPEGTPIEKTQAVAEDVERYILDELYVNAERKEGITRFSTFIGQGAPRFTLTYSGKKASPEYAFMMIDASSFGVCQELMDKIDNYCFEHYPDLRTTIGYLGNGPGADYPVEVRVSGRDMETLFRYVSSIKDKLSQIPSAKNIKDDWGIRTKKIVVDIDQPRARRAGVTSEDIAISLQTALDGFETTSYRENDKLIPIQLRSIEADKLDINNIDSLNVYAMSGTDTLPLKSVADIKVEWQPAVVYRRDGLKTVTIQSQLVGDSTVKDVLSELVPFMDGLDWQVGYSYELGGDSESADKANDSIVAKLPVAAFIILLLVVSQFNSFRRSFIIIATIPLSLIGVVIGLLCTGVPFGFMAFLGMISLAGVVINNAIILLDRINIEIESGLKPYDAVIMAAQRRLRPIFLTAATTILGLFPLWFGGGPMWEPMAIVLIFGLAFCTALTLGVVPALYSVLFKVRKT